MIPFYAAGSSTFIDHASSSTSRQPKVLVQIRFDINATNAHYVMLDTAAPFLVLNNELAVELGFNFDAGPSQKIRTRFGPVEGNLEKTGIVVTADKGIPLDLEVTVFVSQEWRETTVLGYQNALDHLNFAVLPYENGFYFGEIGNQPDRQ